jgi:hypothetical protein
MNVAKNVCFAKKKLKMFVLVRVKAFGVEIKPSP